MTTMIEDRTAGGGTPDVMLAGKRLNRGYQRNYGSMKATEVDQHIGSRIRAGRRLRRVTQRGLADAVGVNTSQVCKYESAENRVMPTMLHAIARALELHPGWFFDDFPADAGRVFDDVEAPPSPADAEAQEMVARILALPREQRAAVGAVIEQFMRAIPGGGETAQGGN